MFGKQARSGRSSGLAAPRLIHFAGTAGRQREMVQRLHRAYLPDGLDIGDHDTLAGPAPRSAWIGAAALAVLDDGVAATSAMPAG